MLSRVRPADDSDHRPSGLPDGLKAGQHDPVQQGIGCEHLGCRVFGSVSNPLVVDLVDDGADVERSRSLEQAVRVAEQATKVRGADGLADCGAGDFRDALGSMRDALVQRLTQYSGRYHHQHPRGGLRHDGLTRLGCLDAAHTRPVGLDQGEIEITGDVQFFNLPRRQARDAPRLGGRLQKRANPGASSTLRQPDQLLGRVEVDFHAGPARRPWCMHGRRPGNPTRRSGGNRVQQAFLAAGADGRHDSTFDAQGVEQGGHSMRPAWTLRIGGRTAGSASNRSPRSRLAYSCPLEVPKYTPSGSRPSVSRPSRSTVTKQLRCGRPEVRATHSEPAFSVRYTRSLPSTVERNWDESSGMVNSTSGSSGSRPSA